jgi:hypothetical protein
MDQMLEEEKFNADKLADSLPLEIGSSKPRARMEKIKRMIHQTIKSSQPVPLNFQNAQA